MLCSPPSAGTSAAAILPMAPLLLLVLTFTIDDLRDSGRWLKRWLTRCTAVARRKAIEIALVLLVTLLLGCFRDTGFRVKEWQSTRPAAGAAPGDPSGFLWDHVWLEPVGGGMQIHGLPDGQVSLKFGRLSRLQRMWNPSRDYGRVICGELEVCVGTFRVNFEPGNFAYLQLLSYEGRIEREYWLRFPAPDRKDTSGQLAIQVRNPD